VTFYQYFTDKC